MCLHTRLSVSAYDEQRELEMRSISSLLIIHFSIKERKYNDDP